MITGVEPKLSKRQTLEMVKLVESVNAAGEFVGLNMPWKTATALERNGLVKYAGDVTWVPTEAGVAWVKRNPDGTGTMTKRMRLNLLRVAKTKRFGPGGVLEQGIAWVPSDTAAALVKRGLLVKAEGYGNWKATPAGIAWAEAYKNG